MTAELVSYIKYEETNLLEWFNNQKGYAEGKQKVVLGSYQPSIQVLYSCQRTWIGPSLNSGQMVQFVCFIRLGLLMSPVDAVIVQ